MGYNTKKLRVSAMYDHYNMIPYYNFYERITLNLI